MPEGWVSRQLISNLNTIDIQLQQQFQMSQLIGEKNVQEKQGQFDIERSILDIIKNKALAEKFSLNQLYQIKEKALVSELTFFQRQKVLSRVQQRIEHYQRLQRWRKINKLLYQLKQAENKQIENDQKRQRQQRQRQNSNWRNFFSTSFKKLFSRQHSQQYQPVPLSEESPSQTHKILSPLWVAEQQSINVVKNSKKALKESHRKKE